MACSPSSRSAKPVSATVSHRHSVEDLVRIGRDLEKIVLSRAIWRHLQRKVIVHEGRTIVFE